MRGTCSRLGRHRPRTNRYFVEINLDSFLAGQLCTTRHSFSWITREAARPLLASTLLRFRRRFNAKVFSAKLSRVYCRRFSILRRAGRFPTTLFRKTEWIRLCPAVESLDPTGDWNKRPDRSCVCGIEIDPSGNPRYEHQPTHRGPTAAGRVASRAGSEPILRCDRQSFFTRGPDHYASSTPKAISTIHYCEFLPEQRWERELPRISSEVRKAFLSRSGYSDKLHAIQAHRRSIFRI